MDSGTRNPTRKMNWTKARAQSILLLFEKSDTDGELQLENSLTDQIKKKKKHGKPGSTCVSFLEPETQVFGYPKPSLTQMI